MAKLKARGRKELARAVKGDREHRLFSDGAILRKVRYSRNTRWTTHGHLKDTASPAKWADIMRADGWIITAPLPLPAAPLRASVARAKRLARPPRPRKKPAPSPYAVQKLLGNIHVRTSYWDVCRRARRAFNWRPLPRVARREFWAEVLKTHARNRATYAAVMGRQTLELETIWAAGIKKLMQG